MEHFLGKAPKYVCVTCNKTKRSWLKTVMCCDRIMNWVSEVKQPVINNHP